MSDSSSDKISRRRFLRIAGTGVALGGASYLTGCGPMAAPPTEAPAEITEAQVAEAYVWGLGIVAMYRYYGMMGEKSGGINQLVHSREPAEPGQFTGGPNRDGLYSFGWFRLDDEPIVVSLPDFGDRYFVWQMTDMYAHNFHNVGSYLREGPVEQYKAGYAFLMAGPDWDGEVPEGLDVVRCPVNLVNVLYRIAVVGEADYGAGHVLQDKTLILPLSDWLKGERSSIQRMPSKPIPSYREVLVFKPGVTGADQRHPMFFSVLADALAASEPYAAWDKEFIEDKLSRLGVAPGKSFDFEALSEAAQQTILDGQESGFDEVIAKGDASFGTKINGWFLNPPNHGDWQDDWTFRAYATYTGGMYPTSNNSTYATTYYDREGTRLGGKNTYLLRFEGDNLPPVTSFWSVTAYDAGTRDLYPNEAKLYNYGTNIPDTRYGKDGSVEIILSHTAPENVGEVNWLPIPEDGAWMVLRFYAPKQEVINLEYEIPGIVRIG